MRDVLLYAPQDRRHADRFLSVCSVDALGVGYATLTRLTSFPIQRVLLCMSIDLLLPLVKQYKSLRVWLRKVQREGCILVLSVSTYRCLSKGGASDKRAI